LTSKIIASTQNGACSVGVCVNVQGTNQITITDAAFVPNAETSNFTPGYNILGSCGVDLFANPNLLPTILTLPVDQAGNFVVAISNNGSQFLEMYLQTDVNQPTGNLLIEPFATAPNIISIGARSVNIVPIVFNAQLLYKYWLQASEGGKYPAVGFSPSVKSAENGLLPALTWQYSYSPAGNSTQLFYLSVGNIFTQLLLTRPANAPLPSIPIPVTPWYSYLILFLCLAFFIIMLLRTIYTDHRVIKIRNRALAELRGMTSYYYP